MNGARMMGCPHARYGFGFCLTSYAKINSKCIKDPNTISKTIKQCEVNISTDLWIGKWFIKYDTDSRRNKIKNEVYWTLSS
jgi:hypothetical protein